MNPDAQKWADLAAYDLATAEAMLASGRYLYVLFCSQQAVEKLIKAMIVEKNREFPPRTHDLIRLARAARIPLSEGQDLFLRTLTKYYIGTRYPEEIATMVPEATQQLAKDLLSRTKDTLKWIETLPA